jgi:hypothetical protein
MVELCKLRVSNSLVTETLPCLTCGFPFLGAWFRAIAKNHGLETDSAKGGGRILTLQSY